MKKIFAILVLLSTSLTVQAASQAELSAFDKAFQNDLISSKVSAASDDCARQLDSMLYRAGEASRLDAAAIEHGLRSDGHIEKVDKFSAAVPDYVRLANDHREDIDKMKVEFKANCLK